MKHDMENIMTTALTTLSSLRNSLQAFRNSTPRSLGQTGYMKFSKGDWTFGKDDAPLDLDGSYILHPHTLMHGWICWRNGSLFNEILIPFTQQLPPEESIKPAAPDPAPDSDDQPGYQHQMAFQVVGVDGRQAGTQLTFKTGTVGGRSAVDKLVEALMARMDDVEARGGEGGIFPVVQFATDSYKHKTRGKIFVPLIEVVGWSTNEPGDAIEWDGDDDEGDEEVPPPSPVSAQKRLKRG